MHPRTLLTLPLLASVLLSPVQSAPDSPVAAEPTAFWVGTWATSPQPLEPKDLPPAPGLSHNTLRQIVQVSIGGARLRVRLSNFFGAGPVTVAALEIARAADGSAIQTDTSRTVTFQGGTSVTLAPGTECSSDPVPFEIAPLSELAVTIRFGDAPKSVTGHPGARCTSYLQPGDAVTEPRLPGAVEFPHWYVLTGIDVEGDHEAAAVAVVGDSITDGRGSTTDRNRRWTDDLARCLQADSRTNHVGVLNEGIGGNRLLHDGLGPNALSRLDRDVFAQSGVRWLVLLEGVNDIGTGPPDDKGAIAREVIGAYEEIIRRAHAHHLRVYGATITPFGKSFYSTPAREDARQTVNRWIRTNGQFDAVIDFDAAVRDPADPSCLAASFDIGDHLHLSDAGYEVMARVVDPMLFSR